MRRHAEIAEYLSGGACKGYYDIGYMRAREETGLAREDTEKGGVSTGSIWTSFMSEGVRSEDVVEYVYYNQNELSRSLFNKKLGEILSLPSNRNRYSLIKELSKIIPSNGNERDLRRDENGYVVSEDGKVLPRTGISSTETLKKFLKEFIGSKPFRDLPDLTVFGTDMLTGELLPFNYKTAPDMEVAEGVIISCSVIPLYPIRKVEYMGEMKYVADGGFAQSLPIDIPYQDKHIEKIIGVNLMDVSKKNRNIIKDHWLLDLANINSFSNGYKTRMTFRDMGKNYDEAVEEECFVTKVKGKKKYILLLTPSIRNDYLLKTDIESFDELYEMGYEESKNGLDKFEGFTSRKGFLGIF